MGFQSEKGDRSSRHAQFDSEQTSANAKIQDLTQNFYVEHPELVADRIIAFADIVDRENVIAGTDCGLGGRVHPQIAWAKLRALREGAALASKKLWS